MGADKPEIKTLQQILNKLNFTISLEGPGSIGNETTYFGQLTKDALSRFQLKSNIAPPNGRLGPQTRLFMNLYYKLFVLMGEIKD